MPQKKSVQKAAEATLFDEPEVVEEVAEVDTEAEVATEPEPEPELPPASRPVLQEQYREARRLSDAGEFRAAEEASSGASTRCRASTCPSR